MFGIVLAILSALSWGCGDFLSGLMSRRLALAAVLLVTQAAGVPLMAALAFGVRGVPADWGFVPLAALAGLTGLFGLGALFRGLAVGSMSIVTPISATGAALPVVVGIVTGELPTPLQSAGILCALTGVVLASRPAAPSAPQVVDQDQSQRSGSLSGPRAVPRSGLAAGAGFGLLAAFGFGLFYVVLRAASVAASDDPFWPVLIARGTSTLFLCIACLVLRPPLALSPREGGTLALAGALDVSANALYAAASTTGIGALAAVLSSLFPVTTIGLARLVLKERVSRLQGTGVLLALIGVALIAWR